MSGPSIRCAPTNVTKKHCFNPYHLDRFTGQVNNSEHVIKANQPAREAEVLAIAKIGPPQTWELDKDNELYCQPVV